MHYDPLSPCAFGMRQRTDRLHSMHAYFKGLKDVVNPKALLNPIKHVKDSIKTIKKSPIEGLTQLSSPGMGAGVRPAAVNQFIMSKGKDKFDPNRPLSNKLLPSYEKPPEPVLPPAPVPDAPYSMRSRSVTDKMKASKQASGRRRGFLGTLFAGETGGFGSGSQGGSSLLG